MHISGCNFPHGCDGGGRAGLVWGKCRPLLFPSYRYSCSRICYVVLLINIERPFHLLYACLLCKEISIYVFPGKELLGLSPNFHIHVSVSDLYIPTIGPPIFLQQDRQTDRGNI
jgi:hypothetical protein